MKVLITDNITGITTEVDACESISVPNSATPSEPTELERIQSLEATDDQIVDVLATALGVTI